QVTITPGAQWVNAGNASVVLNNMDLVVNGSFTPGTGSVKFTGNQNSTISGLNAVNFSILEIAKTNNAKVQLQHNINVGYSINFISGLLDLNNNNAQLASSAFVAGETENNRITGTNGGYIEIIQDLNAPMAANPGNLGAIISSAANLGSVTVRRGHNVLSGTGLTAGINRYFNIMPANNNSLNATVRVKYFDAELNAQTENALVQFKSTDNGLNWTNQSFTTRDAATNYVEKTGHNNMSIFTLATDNALPPPSPAGVTGLVFNAKRKKATEVQVTWTTATETNMSGFEVQRRLKNEADFSARGFVNSKAPGGNSNSQLSYSYLDANAYTDTSYYRLKIVDLNGGFTYSEIKAVFTKAKGGGGGNHKQVEEPLQTKTGATPMELIAAKITVGPNPNNGNFWFSVTGLEKEATATLYTIDGRSLRNFKVMNNQQQQVGGLSNGIYLLKVPGIDAFRVVVQGSTTTSPAPSAPATTKY
ncbi:MAG TPA: T9SS type A sorting domain-containing protein, partial [Chitinophagaceae bacterium]